MKVIHVECLSTFPLQRNCQVVLRYNIALITVIHISVILFTNYRRFSLENVRQMKNSESEVKRNFVV